MKVSVVNDQSGEIVGKFDLDAVPREGDLIQLDGTATVLFTVISVPKWFLFVAGPYVEIRIR